MGLVFVFVIAGCRSATTDTTSTTPVPTVPQTAGLGPSSEPPAWFENRENLDETVEAAIRRDLATMLGVDETAVVRRGAAPVLFRDTALGCPAESELMTGADVRGWIAYYEVAERLYRVHGSRSGEFRLCDLPELDVIPELER
jgi:hypothetical protein